MHKWKNRSTAWIACLAILLAAFLPSISAAIVLQHEVAAFTALICSEHAPHQASSQETAPSHHDAHFDHCPLCVKHGNAYGMLHPADFTIPEAAADPQIRVIGQVDYLSAPAWTLHPSRAPPVRA